MSEDTEFHLVEQMDPILWDAFVSELKPLFKEYVLKERGLLEQPTPTASIESE